MTSEELQQLAKLVAKEVVALLQPTYRKNPFQKAVKLQTAADTLECSRDKIYDLVNSGELETVKIMGSTYITIKSLEAIQTPK